MPGFGPAGVLQVIDQHGQAMHPRQLGIVLLGHEERVEAV
jgi:hypothetical protein